MSERAPSNRRWRIALVAAIVAGPLLGVLGNAWAAQTFPDVPPGNIFYDQIEWGAANGIINGYTNGKFGPNDGVTRGQAAAFLSNYNDGIETVTEVRQVSAGDHFFASILCPPGKRAIGGAAYTAMVDVFLTDTDLNGRQFAAWFESEGNVEKTPLPISITAVCVPSSLANPN